MLSRLKKGEAGDESAPLAAGAAAAKGKRSSGSSGRPVVPSPRSPGGKSAPSPRSPAELVQLPNAVRGDSDTEDNYKNSNNFSKSNNNYKGASGKLPGGINKDGGVTKDHRPKGFKPDRGSKVSGSDDDDNNNGRNKAKVKSKSSGGAKVGGGAKAGGRKAPKFGTSKSRSRSRSRSRSGSGSGSGSGSSKSSSKSSGSASYESYSATGGSSSSSGGSSTEGDSTWSSGSRPSPGILKQNRRARRRARAVPGGPASASDRRPVDGGYYHYPNPDSLPPLLDISLDVLSPATVEAVKGVVEKRWNELLAVREMAELRDFAALGEKKGAKAMHAGAKYISRSSEASGRAQTVRITDVVRMYSSRTTSALTDAMLRSVSNQMSILVTVEGHEDTPIEMFVVCCPPDDAAEARGEGDGSNMLSITGQGKTKNKDSKTTRGDRRSAREVFVRVVKLARFDVAMLLRPVDFSGGSSAEARKTISRVPKRDLVPFATVLFWKVYRAAEVAERGERFKEVTLPRLWAVSEPSFLQFPFSAVVPGGEAAGQGLGRRVCEAVEKMAAQVPGSCRPLEWDEQGTPFRCARAYFAPRGWRSELAKSSSSSSSTSTSTPASDAPGLEELAELGNVPVRVTLDIQGRLKHLPGTVAAMAASGSAVRSVGASRSLLRAVAGGDGSAEHERYAGAMTAYVYRDPEDKCIRVSSLRVTTLWGVVSTLEALEEIVDELPGSAKQVRASAEDLSSVLSRLRETRLVAELRDVGLIVRREVIPGENNGPDGSPRQVLLVSSPNSLLERRAEHLAVRKLVAPRADGAFVAGFTPEMFLRRGPLQPFWRETSEDPYLYRPYFQDSSTSDPDSPFSPSERIQLVISSIEGPKAVPGGKGYVNPWDGGADIDTRELMAEQVIEDFILLHDGRMLEDTRVRWAPWSLDEDQIKDYFGIKIAFYFSFLQSYTAWLLIPALLGVVAFLFEGSITEWIAEADAVPRDRRVMVAFCFLMAIWATVFLEAWKRRAARLSYLWDVTGKSSLNSTSTVRPEFVTALRRAFPSWRTRTSLLRDSLFPATNNILVAVREGLAYIGSIGSHIAGGGGGDNDNDNTRRHRHRGGKSQTGSGGSAVTNPDGAGLVTCINGHVASEETIRSFSDQSLHGTLEQRSELFFYPPRRRWLKQVVSYLVCILITTALLGVLVVVFVTNNPNAVHNASSASEAAPAEVATADDELTRNVIVGVLNGVAIPVLNALFKVVAVALTNWEYHRTYTSYDSAIISKLFMFRFCNTFAPLFLIAFVARSMSHLSSHLAAQLITGSITNNIIELSAPAFKKWWNARGVKREESKGGKTTAGGSENDNENENDNNNKNDGDGDGDGDSDGVLGNAMDILGLDRDDAPLRYSGAQVGTELAMIEYDTLQSAEDHLELVIQYGLLTMFVPAFPLAALVGLISNVVENYVDRWKFCHLTRRPVPTVSVGIGSWLTVLEFMSVIAVITNIGLLGVTDPTRLAATNADYFCGGAGTDGSYPNHFPCRPFDFVWLVVLLEHVVIGLKVLLMVAIPEDTADVVADRHRQLFFERKEEGVYEQQATPFAVTRVAGDSDDEEPRAAHFDRVARGRLGKTTGIPKGGGTKKIKKSVGGKGKERPARVRKRRRVKPAGGKKE